MPAPPYSPPTSYFWKTLNLFLQTTSCSQFGGHLGCHAAAFFLFSFSESLFLGFPPPLSPSLPPSRPTSLDNCHIRCVCRIYRDICHVTIQAKERDALENAQKVMTQHRKTNMSNQYRCHPMCFCTGERDNIYIYVYKHIPPHMYIYLSLSLCARGYVVLNVNVWHSSVYIYIYVRVCACACICGFKC